MVRAQSLYERLIGRWVNFEKKAEGYVPFTPLNLIYLNLDKRAKSILDVGCGRGWPMEFINRNRRFFTVGVDIFAPFLRECNQQGTYNEYVLCDIRKLPVQRKSFDIVLCSRVLEHLDTEEGKELLEQMAEIARLQVAIIVPVGEFTQKQAIAGNVYHIHRSTWFPAELRELGYKVKATGIRNMQGETGFMARLPKFCIPLCRLLWVLFGPVVYFFPELGNSMVCTKRLKL